MICVGRFFYNYLLEEAHENKNEVGKRFKFSENIWNGIYAIIPEQLKHLKFKNVLINENVEFEEKKIKGKAQMILKMKDAFIHTPWAILEGHL